MKLLHFILFFCYGVLSAQTIVIPDPVFRSKLIAEGVDTSNDGKIQQNEASLITELNLSTSASNPSKIMSMEGIEFFVNLITLHCSGNLIQNLDVSSLARLETLDCSSNLINDLNVSGLLHLKFLSASNNQLSTVAISSLESLEKLFCNNNKLSSLELPPVNALEFVLISQNQLTQLVLNNANLVTYLDCSENQLSTINVFGMENLRSLYVGNNLIEEINVSQAPVYNLHCENNPNLTYINTQNGFTTFHSGINGQGFNFINLPKLEFICLDPEELLALSNSDYDPSRVTIATGPECTLATTDVALSETYLYPNPVKNDFHISSKTIISNYTLFNANGKMISNGSDFDLIKKTAISLSSGVHFLKVETTNNQQTVLKFVKE